MNPGQFFFCIYELAETWTHLKPIDLLTDYIDLNEDEDDTDEIKLSKSYSLFLKSLFTKVTPLLNRNNLLESLHANENLSGNEQIKYENEENNILDMLIEGKEKQFVYILIVLLVIFLFAD